MVELSCRVLIADDRDAPVVYSRDSISFVGGVNIETGCIADPRHDRFGECISGTAFAFPFGKGSSGAGLVLMEMLRIGTAPAALINLRTDPVLLTGPVICKHFYQQVLPIVNLDEASFHQLADFKHIRLFKHRHVVQLS